MIDTPFASATRRHASKSRPVMMSAGALERHAEDALPTLLEASARVARLSDTVCAEHWDAALATLKKVLRAQGVAV